MKDLENIYNTYLRISRSKKNLPFTLKKDFSKIEEHQKYATLLKLKNFFDRNSYVSVNDFIEAPYIVYEDENYFDLDFYLTQKAIKTYNLYRRKKTFSEPDSDIQKKAVKDGLVFIYKFCKTKNFDIDDYFNHKDGAINTIFVHLKQKNISIYNCLAYDNFQKILNDNNYELLEFMLGDTISKISIFRTKFYSSKDCKNISKEGLKIIKEKLAKEKK